MDVPVNPARGFFDPRSDILRAHRESYLEKFGHIWVLGDRHHTLDRSARVTRQLKDQEQIEKEARPAPANKGGIRSDLPQRPRPVTHAESKLLGSLLCCRGTRVLVVGEGGIGKSEIVRHFAYELAEQMSPHDADSSTLRVPVFIDLKELAIAEPASQPEKDGPLFDAVLRETLAFSREGDIGKGFFRTLAKTGKLILLLDGLDEMHERAASRLEEMLPVALGGALRECSIVLATRPSALSQSATNLFTKSEWYVPEMLTVEDIESYIQHVFSTPGQDIAQGNRLLKALQLAAGGVRELLRRPLMLALTCIAYERGTIELPKSPAGLMHKALHILLDRRKVERPAASLAVLADLALVALSSGGRVTYERAVQQTRALKETSGEVKDAFDLVPVEAILADLALRSGFFFGNPSDDFHFSNKPLAEYLAGRHLASQSQAEIVETFATRCWQISWEQPLYWLAGELWREKPEQRELAEQMSSSLLEHHRVELDDVAETLLRMAESFIIAAGDGKLDARRHPALLYLDLMRVRVPIDEYDDLLKGRRIWSSMLPRPVDTMPIEIRSVFAELAAQDLTERDSDRYVRDILKYARRLGCPVPSLLTELFRIFRMDGGDGPEAYVEPMARWEAYQMLRSLGQQLEPSEARRFLEDPQVIDAVNSEEAAKEIVDSLLADRSAYGGAGRSTLLSEMSIRDLFGEVTWQHSNAMKELQLRDQVLFRGPSRALAERLSNLGVVGAPIVPLWGGRSDDDCYAAVNRSKLKLAQSLRPRPSPQLLSVRQTGGRPPTTAFDGATDIKRRREKIWLESTYQASRAFCDSLAPACTTSAEADPSNEGLEAFYYLLAEDIRGEGPKACLRLWLYTMLRLGNYDSPTKEVLRTTSWIRDHFDAADWLHDLPDTIKTFNTYLKRATDSLRKSHKDTGTEVLKMLGLPRNLRSPRR